MTNIIMLHEVIDLELKGRLQLLKMYENSRNPDPETIAKIEQMICDYTHIKSLIEYPEYLEEFYHILSDVNTKTDGSTVV